MTEIEIVYSKTNNIPKSNFVTSPHVFTQGRNARNKADRDLDMDGLYSPRIFGRFGACKCGVTTRVNKVCSNCGYRVLSSHKKSQFAYRTICKVLRFGANINMLFTKLELASIPKDIVKQILDIASYQNAVLIDGEGTVEVLSVQEAIDKSDPDTSEIFFGKEALAHILSPEIMASYEQKEDNVLTEVVMISHPVTRPYTITNNSKIVLPDSTEALSRLIARDIRARKNIEFMAEIQDEMINVLSYMAINQTVQEYYQAVYEVFASTPRSVRKSHIVAANSSSIGRYVLVNNPHLRPYEVAVPLSFVYANYKVHDAMSIDEINEFLSKEKVLLNRPPTVSNLSMMTLVPQVGAHSVVGINPAIATGFNADFDGDQVIILPIRNKKDSNTFDYWEQRRELVTGGWKNGLLKRQIEFILEDESIQKEIGVPEKIIKEQDHDSVNTWFNELSYEEHMNALEAINLNLHKAVGITLDHFHLTPKGRVTSDSHLLDGDQDEDLFNTEFDHLMIADFRNGVITSKVGITESGYFYKKAVAAGEYYRLKFDDCGATAVKITVKDISEFNRRVRNHYDENNQLAVWSGPGEYTIHTVMSCGYTLTEGEAPDRNNPEVRGVCSRCFGFIGSTGMQNSPYLGVNVGIILSEVISQETLNAINLGAGDMSVLKILENKFVGTRQEVIDFIEDSYKKFIDSTSVEMEDRWIQAQFLSTTYQVHYKRKALPEATFEVMSKISSMKMSDPLTHWIQSPQLNLFTQMIGKPFSSSSLKSWAMLNKKG